MRTLLPSLVLILSGALAGCSLFGVDGAESTLGDGEVVTLQEGQSTALSSVDATLRFDATLEDSRCPLNAECIWSGEAKIQMTLTPDAQNPIPFILEGFIDVGGVEEGVVYTEVAGLRISLTRLDPYPVYVEGDQQDSPATARLVIMKL